ncbi:MAG TPA: metallophosphoesterase [Blastocatellia bacterium]|nr:metallophosphoesterase [Blastocatellia bacterium]
MRVFTLSDIHVDYSVNARWIEKLSTSEYRDDLLILAGDVSDSLRLLEWSLTTLAARFKQVLYVPGNHDLWVIRDGEQRTSLEKFDQVSRVAEQSGASMQPFHYRDLSIIPLLGWYDYSFGQPGSELRRHWMDYRACRWPDGFEESQVATYFESLNNPNPGVVGGTCITFSHFLPRIDLMPEYIPKEKRILYPVLGSARLDEKIRALKPKIHVYGHSHVNRRIQIDGITYVNNAFGYPRETSITSKQLLCIHPPPVPARVPVGKAAIAHEV